MVTRNEIITEALSWEGTPYQHQVGCKAVGVDCAYLIGKIAEKVGAIDSFKVAPYSLEWHWHSNVEKMCEIVESFGAIEIDVSDAQPGDILAFKYGRVCSHLGIMLNNNQMIHAHLKCGKVVINSIEGEFKERLKRAYKFPNIEE